MSKKIRSVLAIALALVVGAPVVSSSVLCVGEDGHRSIEAAVDGRCHDGGGACGDLPSPCDAPAHRDGDHGSCCGDCVDVVLETEPVFHRGDCHQLDTLARSIIAPIVLRPSLMTLADRALIAGPAASPPDRNGTARLTVQRTVVLRA